MRRNRTGVKKRRFQLYWPFLCALIFVLSLVSCFSPIDQEMVDQKRDKSGPKIVIQSPMDGSYYTELVVVTGSVTDDSGTSDEAGEIKSLSYEIIGALGTLETSELSYDADGSFSFEFAAVTIDGSAVVKIKATDWNGNQGESSITLKDPGSEIPSFSVRPGNKEVELSWNPVPGAVRYTVHYTTNDSPPSISYGRKVVDIPSSYSADSPLIISDLENGGMHVFLLQAHPSDESDIWLSNNVKAIPLSPMTLTPVVTGEYGRIRVEWNEISATDYFEVLRSTERNGSYENISGTVETTSFIDEAVEEDQVYYYKIRPSFTGSVESDVNCSQTSPFTFEDSIELISSSRFKVTGPSAVAVRGNYAYMGYQSGVVYKIDISSPQKPIIRAWGKSGVAAPLGDIAADDRYVYIAYEKGGGFHVLDANSLSIVASPFPTGDVSGIALDGDYVYVVYYGSVPVQRGLYKFDTRNFKITPGFLSISGYPADVAVDGPGGLYAYVTNRTTSELHRIDKSSLIPDSSLGLGIKANRVSVTDNYVYVTGYEKGFQVVDLPGFSPTDVRNGPKELYPTDVTAVGSYAYVTDWKAALYLINVFPKEPILTAFCPKPAPTESVAVSGRYAYVADSKGALSVIDVSTSIPDNPTAVDTDSSSTAGGVAVSGSYAYVADESRGLQVLDISNPASLIDAGSCDTPGIEVDVAVSGSYAFIAVEDDPATTEEDETGLQIVKTSDLDSPVGSVPLPGDPKGVALKGHYAYIAAGEAGIQIIDVSFPSDPVRVGFRDMPGADASSIAIRGNYAFVAAGGDGLVVVDISEPRNPLILPTPYVPSASCDIKDVVISGNFAFVADGDWGLRVVDISFPNNPVEIGECVTPGTAESVAVSGNYAFVGDGTSGLQVIDITIPNNPTNIGGLASAGAGDVVVTGGSAFLVDTTAGVVSVDLLPTL